MWMILSESSLFWPSKIYISSLYTKLMHSYIFRWRHVWSQMLEFLLLIFFPFISLAEAVLLGDTFLNPIRSAALLDENRASTLRFSWRERKKERSLFLIHRAIKRKASVAGIWTLDLILIHDPTNWRVRPLDHRRPTILFFMQSTSDGHFTINLWYTIIFFGGVFDYT